MTRMPIVPTCLCHRSLSHTHTHTRSMVVGIPVARLMFHYCPAAAHKHTMKPVRACLTLEHLVHGVRLDRPSPRQPCSLHLVVVVDELRVWIRLFSRMPTKRTAVPTKNQNGAGVEKRKRALFQPAKAATCVICTSTIYLSTMIYCTNAPLHRLSPSLPLTVHSCGTTETHFVFCDDTQG